MSQTPDAEDAREAALMGEKPDLGHTPDALRDVLTGTDVGSDTRAGSSQGGAASGSDRGDSRDDQGGGGDPTDEVNSTPEHFTGPAADPAEGKPGGDADAVTG
jgi:hypothetical protein